MRSIFAAGIASVALAALASGTVAEASPPRRFKLTRENRDFAKRIGIRFDGKVRSDVIAYDADEGFIVMQGDVTAYGEVEPYWRHPPATVAARSEKDDQRAQDAAQAKRDRKAAKRLAK